MLGTIGKLFGRSPFAPLQAHMEKVSVCVHRLPSLLDALENEDHAALKELAKEISKLEHQADLSKNDIRNHLPKSLFLPVDRGNLLDILSVQDSLADHAEDIAVLLTLTDDIKLPSGFGPLLRSFLQKNIDTFELVEKIIHELPELLESSFGGKEAEKVRAMVDDVAHAEHEVDVMQRELLREIFSRDEELSHSTFFLWMRCVEQMAELSNASERLGHRIRMTLELK